MQGNTCQGFKFDLTLKNLNASPFSKSIRTWCELLYLISELMFVLIFHLNYQLISGIRVWYNKQHICNKYMIHTLHDEPYTSVNIATPDGQLSLLIVRPISSKIWANITIFNNTPMSRVPSPSLSVGQLWKC